MAPGCVCVRVSVCERGSMPVCVRVCVLHLLMQLSAKCNNSVANLILIAEWVWVCVCEREGGRVCVFFTVIALIAVAAQRQTICETTDWLTCILLVHNINNNNKQQKSIQLKSNNKRIKTPQAQPKQIKHQQQQQQQQVAAFFVT